MLVPNPNRFSGTFLSKYIHRKRPAPSTLRILLCKAATASSICDARLHISGGEGRTDSGLAPLESRSSLWGGGASASRFSSTFLSKDIHRKRPAPGCTSVKTPYPNPNPNLCWCATFFSLLFLDPINIYFFNCFWNILTQSGPRRAVMLFRPSPFVLVVYWAVSTPTSVCSVQFFLKCVHTARL